LLAHEAPELRPREWPLLVKNDEAQVFFESELSLFVDFEDKAVPLFHLGPIQLELRHGTPPGVVVPSVGEQDTADIHKHTGNRRCFLHIACAKEAEDACGESHRSR